MDPRRRIFDPRLVVAFVTVLMLGGLALGYKGLATLASIAELEDAQLANGGLSALVLRGMLMVGGALIVLVSGFMLLRLLSGKVTSEIATKSIRARAVENLIAAQKEQKA